MEQNDLRKLVYKTLAKAAITGLVGMILTVGAVKSVEGMNAKSSVGALGTYLSGIAAAYQIFRARKEYY